MGEELIHYKSYISLLISLGCFIMLYAKPKSKSKWLYPSAENTSGIAILSKDVDDGLHGVHPHLDLTHISEICTKSGSCSSSNDNTPRAFNDVEDQSTPKELDTIEEQSIVAHDDEKHDFGMRCFVKVSESPAKKVRINSPTAEMQSMRSKIESLEDQNHRLEEQITEFSEMMEELESARAKLRESEKKSRKNWAKKKEVLHRLNQQVGILQVKEAEHLVKEDRLTKKIHELEGEVEELKKMNQELLSGKQETEEGSESVQDGTPQNEEVEKDKEEVRRLKIANSELSKQLEVFRTERKADVEELVYLRWLNACLKYELEQKKNPQKPHKGKKSGYDSSKSAGYDSDSSTVTDMQGSPFVQAESRKGGGTPSPSTAAAPIKPKLIKKLQTWVRGGEKSKKVHFQEELVQSTYSAQSAGEELGRRSDADSLAASRRMDYASDVAGLPSSRQFLLTMG